MCDTLTADSAFLHASNEMTVRLKRETQTEERNAD